MKYCSHCGAELLDEAVICPKCGCQVAPYDTYLAPKAANTNAVSSGNATTSSNATAAMVMGILSLSISVVAFFVYGFLEILALGLSLPGLILGSKTRSNGVGKAGFITSIIATCISGVGLVLYVLSVLMIISLF